MLRRWKDARLASQAWQFGSRCARHALLHQEPQDGQRADDGAQLPGLRVRLLVRLCSDKGPGDFSVCVVCTGMENCGRKSWNDKLEHLMIQYATFPSPDEGVDVQPQWTPPHWRSPLQLGTVS